MIALQLTGQARGIVYSLPTIIEKIIKPYNPDVYIHTCFDDSVYNLFKCIDFPCVSVVAEKDQELNYQCKLSSHPRIQEYWQQLHGLKRVQEEMDKYGYQYEYVIRCRLDLRLKEFDLNDIQPDTLHVPEYNSQKGLNDQLAVAGPDIMRRYNSRWKAKGEDHNAEMQLDRWMAKEYGCLRSIESKVMKMKWEYDRVGQEEKRRKR